MERVWRDVEGDRRRKRQEKMMDGKGEGKGGCWEETERWKRRRKRTIGGEVGVEKRKWEIE